MPVDSSAGREGGRDGEGVEQDDLGTVTSNDLAHQIAIRVDAGHRPVIDLAHLSVDPERDDHGEEIAAVFPGMIRVRYRLERR